VSLVVHIGLSRDHGAQMMDIARNYVVSQSTIARILT
jgi:hypothetical protein